MMIVFDDKIILRRVISGGQTGADVAGLDAAKTMGYETGGHAPLGFRTLNGPNLRLRDEYGLEETKQSNYQVRTALNVKNSDATIRFATNFNSPGELCTLKAINKFNKPRLDVDLTKYFYAGSTDMVRDFFDFNQERIIRFLIDRQVIVLNIAGNADHGDSLKHYGITRLFLVSLFEKIKKTK